MHCRSLPFYAATCDAVQIYALSQKRLDKHPSPDACRVAFRCFAIPCIARQGGSQTHAPSVTDAWVSPLLRMASWHLPVSRLQLFAANSCPLLAGHRCLVCSCSRLPPHPWSRFGAAPAVVLVANRRGRTFKEPSVVTADPLTLAAFSLAWVHCKHVYSQGGKYL